MNSDIEFALALYVITMVFLVATLLVEYILERRNK